MSQVLKTKKKKTSSRRPVGVMRNPKYPSQLDQEASERIKDVKELVQLIAANNVTVSEELVWALDCDALCQCVPCMSSWQTVIGLYSCAWSCPCQGDAFLG